MRSKAYGSVAVNRVEGQKLFNARAGEDVVVGLDIGKYQLMAVARWSDGTFERPWRVGNPGDLGELVALLTRLGRGRRLVVALEPGPARTSG